MTAVIDGDRAAWLQRRRTGIGASDVAAILGLSRHDSPWSIWADKCELLPLDDDGGQYLDERKFGRYAERMVAPWFHDETDLWVVGEQSECVHPEAPWRRCTVDGFVAESPDTAPEDGLGLLQIKTRERGRRWEQIPADIQAQELWEMDCTGLDRAWVAVLMGRRLDIHVMDRDQADVDFVVERVTTFWEQHVLTGTPPPTDGHDATLSAIAAVYPHETPGTAVELDNLAAVLAEWRAAKASETAAKQRAKTAAAEIQAALGDAEEGTVNGERAVSWRQQTRAAHVVAESSFRVLRAHGDLRNQERQPA